jgi:hypothetical protein
MAIDMNFNYNTITTIVQLQKGLKSTIKPKVLTSKLEETNKKQTTNYTIEII